MSAVLWCEMSSLWLVFLLCGGVVCWLCGGVVCWLCGGVVCWQCGDVLCCQCVMLLFGRHLDRQSINLCTLRQCPNL